MREMEYPSYEAAAGPRLHWSSIIAGSVMSIVVMACLSVLGVGIGLMAAPAADTAKGLAMGMGIGASVFMLVSGIVSFYVGGWFASRLSDCGRPADGALFGIMSWATTTLVAAFVFTSAIGSLFGSVAGAIGATAQSATQGATAGLTAQGDQGGTLADRIRSAGREIRQEARQTQDQLQARTGGGGPTAPTREQAVQKAETASKAAGGFGLFTFLMLLIEGVAAAIGGRVGARLYVPVPVTQFRREVRRETAHAHAGHR